MKRIALEKLVAPDTGEPLQLEVATETGDDVREGVLRAGSRQFPIRNGIASFVAGGAMDDQTIKSFDDKWGKHRYYRKHTERFYTEWYVARYGLKDADGLRAFLKDKRTILDAGTGSGRDASNFAAHNPEALVFGADTAWQALSSSTAEGAHLVHADVNHLPFRDGFFDFINCDQVIHHTPDPPVTFRNLGKKLRQGGEAAVYVYRKKAVVREFTDDYIRDRIKDQSFEQALEVCEGITKLGKALSDLKATITVEDDIPVLGIRKGTYDVQRFVHWNLFKCFWNDEFDFFTNNVVNADWYHPVHCFRYTPEEFRSWFDQGWEILTWDEQDAGISCRARKL